MTEAEWLACEDPGPMLEFLRGKASERKLRLFAVGCCRRALRLLSDQRANSVLEVAERLADGLANNAERRAAAVRINDQQAGGSAGHVAWGAVCCTVAVSAAHAAERSSEGSASASGYASTTIPYTATYGDNTAFFAAVSEGTESERAAQAPLLRDIFGNPFRPVCTDPAWLAWNTGTVPKLARAIYDGRAFDRLPVLADALEDAGCSDPGILAHLRGQGPHVRGCWAVDLLLGKE